jgi:hypothetical protein
MDINQLIGFLNRIYVWLPHDNSVRAEVSNVITQLKFQRDGAIAPPVEIVKEEKNEKESIDYGT